MTTSTSGETRRTGRTGDRSMRRILDINAEDRFRLRDAYVEPYRTRRVDWGPVGYLTFKRTYARPLEDGSLEEWWQTVRRVVEGTYTVQRWHCRRHNLPWSERKARRSAEEMYRLIFEMKFLPPGRGLRMMGTPTVERIGSASLMNCAFHSTDHPDFSRPYTFVFDMSMVGVGCGFDTKGAGKFTIRTPRQGTDVHVVEDSRAGWVAIVRRVLDAYVGKGTLPAEIDYSQVRPAGSPIKGFGGQAAGPEPLRLCLERIHDILRPLARRKITSTAIVDLMDVIGVCVVSGNIRRCLPEGALVHTERGLLPIEEVEPGDRVLTSGTRGDRWSIVTERIVQGRQDLVSIRTQMGTFECTAGHRVAVFSAIGEYGFKRADEVEPGDRMVFVEDVTPGIATSMPAWRYEKPANSTACQEIAVPELDTAMAWWLGYFLGDGYTCARREHNGFNAYVAIPVPPDEGGPALAERVRAGYAAFGVRTNDVPGSRGASRRIRSQSKQLAWYLDEHLKSPKTALRVPSWIAQAQPEIRAAFLAGLLDADGSMKTRPVNLAVSVYPDFLREVRALYASLGIPTRLRLNRPASGTRQALYALDLVGESARARYAEWIAPHAVWQVIPGSALPSPNDYGFPSSWVGGREDGIGIKRQPSRGNRQVTVATLERIGGQVGGLIPVEVLDIELGRTDVPTYDLSVEGAHEFVVEGMLVHNSALIALGAADDREFYALKDPELHGAELMSHRWASNNTVFAEIGMDYAGPAGHTAKNGEPGFFWLENARHYGRFADGRQPGIDAKVGGLNPCVTGDTWVQTVAGPRQVVELVGDPLAIVLDGTPHATISNGFFMTGTKPVFRLETEEGWALRLTADHRILAADGSWRTAESLRPGERIRLGEQRDLVWSGTGRHEEGYLVGLLVGDGTLHAQNAILSSWDRDPGSAGVRAAAEEAMAALPHRRDWAGWNHVTDRSEWRMQSASFTRLAADLGLRTGSPKTVTPAIERSSSAFHAGFLSGLFDADGHVEGSRAKGVSIRLSSADRGLLRAAQRMLGRLGVLSDIRAEHPARQGVLPDGRGGHRAYDCQASERLIVSGRNAARFMERVGFRNDAKTARWQELTAGMPRGFYTKPAVATVASLVPDGIETVYDVTVADAHAFDANGLVAHNCGEQNLESGELCCLVETFPARHASYEEYESTLKYAYLYGKTVSLALIHDPQSNKIQLRNRRIGLSQSGIAQSFARHGRRAHFEWCDRGYRFVRSLDVKYSDWLAVPRSVKVTTIKPAGTTSLMPGATPGMHYEHAEYYYRTVRVSKSSPLLAPLQRANYRIEDDLYDPSTHVVYFPVHARYYDRGKDDLSMWEQLEIAAALQYHWSDNGVSATITFRPEEAPDIPGALELYETRLKAISFLPLLDHGYAQAPYITITREEYEAEAAKLRPLRLTGDVHEVDDAYCDGDKCIVPGAPTGEEIEEASPLAVPEIRLAA